jgi:glutamyl-tRNA reductase
LNPFLIGAKLVLLENFHREQQTARDFEIRSFIGRNFRAKIMERIGQIGISWRNGGPEALARFTVPVDKRADWLQRFARMIEVNELVYLATCNRVEIVFVGDGERPLESYRIPLFKALSGRKPKLGEAERTFRAWGGEGAAEHLFLITSGLDSARVGESDIVGQVHEAYELSRRLGLTGPRLDLLFEEALKVARHVHRRSEVGKGRQSLAEIALDHMRARLRRTPGPIAVVGGSPMTRRCAHAACEDGTPTFVVNRTLERAEALAAEIGGQARTIEAFRSRPDPVEVVVLATGAPDAVLKHQDLERLAARSPSGEPPLIIDLSIPPDVSPVDSRRAGLQRIGMEEVLAEAERNRDIRLLEAADAREIVDEALLSLRRHMVDRVMSPLFAAMQRRFRETALEGAERLFRKELSGLGESEREAVRRWAETLARRFAHIPTAGLRGVAFKAGPAAVEAFLTKADESMVKILREASQRDDIATVSEEEGTA